MLTRLSIRATETQRRRGIKTTDRLGGRAALWLVTAFALALTVAGCGGGGDSSTPTSPSGTTITIPSSDVSITITSSGVSPKALTVSAGSRVTFVNNDSRSHDMASNPHPVHTDCPEINSAGFLQQGQSRATANLNTARTCGYHDHLRDSDTSLQGTITIQ